MLLTLSCPTMVSNQPLKKQLQNHLFGGEAFMPLDELIKLIPYEQLGVRPDKLPYSFYEIFYHLWFTQKDILKYCEETSYTAPKWPQDYWPLQSAPENPEAWTRLKMAFFEDREKLGQILGSNDRDLNAPVPSNKDHSLFREIMLVVEHSAYHTGQLLIILRLLGINNNVLTAGNDL